MEMPTGPHRPTVDTDSERWWAAVQDRTLMLNECGSCGRKSLYVRPFCPHCWCEDVALVSATGRASLYTWTVIHHNTAPFGSLTPYIVAMVDLEEGPRMMTVLQNCSVEELRADMELMIAFREDDDGFVVPVFQPAITGVGKAHK